VRHFAIVCFRKTGPLRFLSHLDVARAIDRAVRRAALPVMYSEGYNPSARIGHAHALPVGTAGRRELCQIELQRPLAADEVLRRLSAELPDDLAPVDVQVVSGQKRKHLSGLERAEYEVELWPAEQVDLCRLQDAVQALLDAETVEIVRETKSRTRKIDVKAGIHRLQLLEPRAPGGGARLRMSLALEQERLVKPTEVVECLRRQLSSMTGRDVALDVRGTTRLGLE